MKMSVLSCPVCCTLLIALLFLPLALPLQAAKPSVLCWQAIGDPLAKSLRGAGFQVVTEPLQNWRWEYMRQFNVIILSGAQAIPEAPRSFGSVADPITPELRANFKRYVEEGGVLIMAPNGYWNTDVWVGRWNAIFAPLFGLEWVGEHPWDTSHLVPKTDNCFWTENLQADHPALAGVGRLYYSVAGLSDGGSPAPLWKELPGWQTLVRAGKEGKSYPTTGQGYTHQQPGSYQSAPPLLSLKSVGKGYAVLDALVTSPATEAERAISEAGLAPDDGGKFSLALLHWLAATSQDSTVIGGYAPPADVVMPVRPPQSPHREWAYFKDVRLPSSEEPVVKVLVGLHSTLSDGADTPEALLAAAQQAGYGAVFFTENMPQMTAEKYAQLQEICRRATTPDFAAFPGFQWQDEGGIEFVTLDLPNWPAKWIAPGTRRMTDKWDVWFQNGMFPIFPLWLRAPNAYPHPWFYMHITGVPVFSYAHNVLKEDNEAWYLYLNEDRIFQHPVCLRMTYSTAEVLAGAQQGYQTYIQGEPASASEALGCAMRNPQHTFVSSGPLLTRFVGVDREPFDIRTANRWAWGFTLHSAQPLRRVQVRDRERVEYALPGAGKTRFDFTFTGYHGKNDSFVLVAEDSRGGRLISAAATTFGLSFDLWQSCSDQQNFIGSPWLFFKGQYNWIRVPPPLHPWGQYKLLGKPVGAPSDGNYGDNGHWLCADPAIGALIDPPSVKSAERFHGGIASRDLVRNDITCDLLQESSTGYSMKLTPRTDCVGAYRLYLFKPQYSEAKDIITYDPVLASYHLPDSRANLAYVEGTVTAKQDIALKPAIFPDVTFLACGSGYAPTWQAQDGYTVQYSGGDGKVHTWSAPAQGGRLQAAVPRGGFIYVLPVHTGSLGFYALDRDMVFLFEHDGKYKWQLRLGMAAPARTVKAGARFSARVAIARVEEGYSLQQAQTCLENVRREFGLSGTKPAFDFTVKAGTLLDQRFLQQVQAQDGGFRGTFTTPLLSWPCVPLAVHGLNDNWDAVIYGDQGPDLRRIAVRDGVGYAGLDPAVAANHEIWIGHPVICDQPAAHLLVLENGPAVCEVQVHNPTDKPMTVHLHSAPSLAGLGILPAFAKVVQVPAGGIVRVREEEKGYTAPPYRDIFYAIDHAQAQGWVVQDLDATWLQAVRSADKPGPMVSAAGQLRRDWENYGPIGVDEPAGPLEMVVRMKLLGKPAGDQPAVRLSVVRGEGPAGLSDYAGRSLANETEVAAREVHTTEFSKPDTYQEIVLPFTRPKDGWLGYHIDWLGVAYVQVDTIVVRQGKLSEP